MKNTENAAKPMSAIVYRHVCPWRLSTRPAQTSFRSDRSSSSASCPLGIISTHKTEAQIAPLSQIHAPRTHAAICDCDSVALRTAGGGDRFFAPWDFCSTVREFSESEEVPEAE